MAVPRPAADGADAADAAVVAGGRRRRRGGGGLGRHPPPSPCAAATATAGGAHPPRPPVGDGRCGRRRTAGGRARRRAAARAARRRARRDALVGRRVGGGARGGGGAGRRRRGGGGARARSTPPSRTCGSCDGGRWTLSRCMCTTGGGVPRGGGSVAGDRQREATHRVLFPGGWGDHGRPCGCSLAPAAAVLRHCPTHPRPDQGMHGVAYQTQQPPREDVCRQAWHPERRCPLPCHLPARATPSLLPSPLPTESTRLPGPPTAPKKRQDG